MKYTNISLKFPSQFASYINNVDKVVFEGDTIADFLNTLEDNYRNIKERLLDNDGELRPYLNLFIGKKNIKSLQGLHSIIPDGEQLSLVLSRAGG